MTANAVTVRADRAAVRDALARIPQEVRGNSIHARAMRLRVGMALLGRIKQAFVLKARGGTDAAGDRWAPLSPRTIAYSRTRSRGRGGRTKKERSNPARPSAALTDGQRHRWWEYYRQGLAIFRSNKGAAARRAWAILRRDGGVTTLLEKYGNRPVEILRDTGLLLNSLSPGTNSPEQVFRDEGGAIIVGTNRKGARWHHEGIPGKLPRRRLWPLPRNWPASWWADIQDQVKMGIADIAQELIRGAS